MDVAGDVRSTARSYVTHKTGRHGGANVPHLAPSIRASVTAYGASVYSDAPQAIVQDSGGRVGRKTPGHPHGVTILQRANVSHYMTEAVREAQPYVTRRLEMLLDELERGFED